MYTPMNQAADLRRCGQLIVLSFLAVVLITGIAIASDPANPEKLDRQIGHLERALDDALVDSPNFLVTSGRNASGFYVPDLGVMFTFNARLVGEFYHQSGFWIGPDADVKISKDEDGDRQIIIRKNKHWDLGRAFGIKDDDKEAHDTVEIYNSGKEELIDLLMDEGASLGTVPDGQFVMICARMNDGDLRREKKIQRLTLKAKIDDLRAYADDKLSEGEMKARIVIVES